MKNEEKVLGYFRKICSIPRASGDEKAAADYIEAFAKERGLETLRDAHHNLIVKKPATVPGTGEPVILQGHLDMVYVKDADSSHVYEDGIEVKDDGEFYFADGTSLGSDNGIAVAYCLALLDSDDIVHPDLEIVFTVKEEVGLLGADCIDISSLKGTRFINLDSEEEGIFYTSCAGGLRCRMFWNVETEGLPDERVTIQAELQGLTGGHSGMNIGMGLGNSIVLLGRILYFLKDTSARVGGIDVQGKANAIANNGCVCLYVKQDELESVRKILQEAEKTFQAELQHTDTISIQIKEGDFVSGALAYTEKYQKNIMKSLMLLPYGVAGYSFAMEGLIETSMNLGSLTMEDKRLTLLMAMRSSVEFQKYMLRDKVQIIAEEYCDEYAFESDYPGWQYRKDSKLRDTAFAVYEKLFEKKAEVAAIHAGLECGYFDSKKPGMDLISMGPDLYDVHSTKEKVSKQSIENMWVFLKELLKELAEEPI